MLLYIGLMDWHGGRAFGRHSRNGGRGICQQKLPAGPGIWPISVFKFPGEDARGRKLSRTLRLLLILYNDVKQ